MLSSEMVIAVISLAGTAIGTFGGIFTSSKLTNYRIQKLEEKVDKHNNFAERMPVIEEQVRVVNQRLSKIENSCKQTYIQ